MRGFKNAVLVAALSVTPALAEHDTPFAQMSFLKGDWIETTKDRTVEEHWIGPVANAMAGVTITYSGEAGTNAALEFTSVERRDGTIVFVARIGDRPPVAFPLKESDNGYAVFENLAHDFPQRVIYAYGGDADTLDARIEGVVDGKPQSMEWHYTRMKPVP